VRKGAVIRKGKWSWKTRMKCEYKSTERAIEEVRPFNQQAKQR